VEAITQAIRKWAEDNQVRIRQVNFLAVEGNVYHYEIETEEDTLRYLTVVENGGTAEVTKVH